MKIGKFLTLWAIFLLLVSTTPVLFKSSAAPQGFEAKLTGTIFDHGVDTNGNGLYDYLEVDVEVNVTSADNFRVTIADLADEFGNSIYVYNYTQGFLNVGIQYLNVSLFGPAIYGSGLNPEKVFSIGLENFSIGLNTANYWYQGGINNVPLSRVYNYTEFDTPNAFLTGHVSDLGVDTDSDGLYNYLEVGIEFNVTKAGEYRVSASGLLDKSGTMTNYLYDYQSDSENFLVGIHTVYFNFSGPEIASKHFNPTDVNYVSMYDIANNIETSNFGFLPLSMQYNYTLFNSPSEDIQLNFKVYPDATVAVNGTLDSRHMYPDNKNGPRINETVGFSTNGNWTTETSNGTVVFPSTPYSSYSPNEEHMHSSYENGLLNSAVNASTTLPPEAAGFYPYNATDVNLTASYSRGLFDVAITGETVIPGYSNVLPFSVFPLNMSDATVRADYDGTAVEGNVTFHAIGGFPFADVTVNFGGNRSRVQFTGNVNITYANYDGLEVNETFLDQKLADLEANITGQGPGSLYNETWGTLECTNLNVTKTPWSDPTLGAYLQYDVTVIGNFTAFIADMLYPPGYQVNGLHDFAYISLESAVSSIKNASLVLSYYHSSQIAQAELHLTSDVQTLFNGLLSAPPTLPPFWSSQQKTQIEAWLKIANATASALTDASFNASYSSTDRKMTVNAWLSANESQLQNDLIPLLPDAVAPNMHDILLSYLNTTYGNINSSTMTFDMVNGTGTFASTETLQGDFEAQLNQEKNFLITAFGPSPPLTVAWELRLLNETKININNFQAEFEDGQDWIHASFSGLILKPQPDTVDFIRFKLRSWMNTTADPNAPPLDFEKFTVVVTGASSANETVLLSQPSDVPAPDRFSGDYRSMVWNNVSLSSLKDLTFLIAYEKQVNYNDKTYDIPIFTNSTVKNFVFDPSAKQITFNVTGSPDTGFCNVTIPRNLLNASTLNDWTITFDGKPLTQEEFSITENAEYVFVYLNYTHSEHAISITATQLVPEFQPNILPLALIVPLIIAAIIAVKQRRKLEPLKTRCRQTLARAKLSLKQG